MNRFVNLDLKTKIVAVCVLLFVGTIWMLAHDVVEEVGKGFEAVVVAEQTTLVEHITDSLEEESKLRINTLDDIASTITPEMVGDARRLHGLLQGLKHTDRLFNLGLSVIDMKGNGIADFPPLEGRATYDFSGDSYFQMVVTSGTHAVSRPRLTPFSNRPVVVLAVPIRGLTREIIGVLAGYNSVSGSDFFTEIIPKQNKLGNEFHVVSTRDRVFVASSNPRRILQPIPEKGHSVVFDHFVEGFEGSKIGLDLDRVENIFSAMRIPSTGWLVIASTPTAVAFAPVFRLQFEIYRDAAMASVIIALAIWFFIYRQLAPLERSARILDAMASGHRALSPLPVEGSREIRRLLGSFNQFQHRISEQKRLLRENAEQLRLAASVFDSTSESIAITDAHNLIVRVNKSFCRLTGYEQDELIGKNPSVLKSGRQDAVFYASMWHSLVTSGEWTGEIWNRRKNGEIYPERLAISSIYNARGEVLHYIAIASDITAQKKAANVIWHQANYDLLTDLPNRRLFKELLLRDITRARHGRQTLALILIDLDRFKEVNDTLGHATGDQLLLETSDRIQACLAETDTLGYLGADEFIATVAGDSRHEAVVENIRSVIARPYRVGIETIFLTASIGTTLYPGDGEEIDELFRNVDQAIQEAKTRGRNRSCGFTESMRQSSQTRQQLATDLRGALAAGQLEVYYQPIVAMTPLRRIVKAEALLRWRHPSRGFVSPAVFIPIAEETGLITEIGDWVFHQAANMAKWLCDHCRHRADGLCRQNDAADPVRCTLQIAVNKSPRQFFTGASHEDWIAHLHTLDVPPQRITIEVTEGLLLNHHVEVIERLKKFREAGIQIALDDFGTGYSAMSYLKRFDIDIIKIDQSFVRDMTTDSTDRTIAEVIILMAHKLGMKVVAEGIETEAQFDLLAAAGCDFGQGYLFARPMSAEQFQNLVGEEWSGWS